MPSSLMARVQAAQQSSSSSSAKGPSSSAAPKKATSSLAAAASKTGGHVATLNNTSKYVPAYKLNPLNAASSSLDTKNVSQGVENVATKTGAAADCSSPSNTPKDCTSTQTSKQTVQTTTGTNPKEEKSIIEKLLQNEKNQQLSHHIPNSYHMCSESEAIDRQTHLELSPFECYPSSLTSGSSTISTISTNNNNYNTIAQCSSSGGGATNARRIRPKHHPQYVIKKYRRSAAGGGTLSEASEGCIRTLEQLDATVEYLIMDIFVWQMPPPTSLTTTGGAPGNDDPNEISIWKDNEEEDDDQEEQHTPFSLCDTVAFIDDRLRAVQKDLVTLLGNIEQDNGLVTVGDNKIAAKRIRLKQLQMKQTVRKMQAKMVRYNILALYLLSDVPPSKYEVKFAAFALRTSVSCYLNLSSTLDDDYNIDEASTSAKQLQYKEEYQRKDEIMAYMALLHSSAVLRSEEQALPPPSSGEVTTSLMEDSGSGWGALLSTFCKHVFADVAVGVGKKEKNGAAIHESSLVKKYPKWKWALQLACMAQEGNFQGYFHLLQSGPSSSSSSITLTREEEVNNARFLLLARCCASHSLNLIRLEQLRNYNHSFGKGEKVSGKDLARLLHFDDVDEESSAKLAIDFCRDAGLPVVEKRVVVGGDEMTELHVAFKTAPITIKEDAPIKRICNPGRRNDTFVFGSCLEDTSHQVNSLANQLDECVIGENVHDWEDIQAGDAEIAGFSDSNFKLEARMDEDGVKILSSKVIRSLMQ
ncbi:hypothetical protein ACHAWC_008427 [Mediolabrus comicus]